MRTISYKTWTFILVFFLAAFIAMNFVIWKLFTEDILTFEPWYNGGLDRLGYLPGAKHYRKPESTLPKRHIANSDYHGQPVDVITIGDSFSNMNFNGRDPLYQDWIATLHNLSVMNIQPLKENAQFSTLITLLNNGYLDKVKPRSIIFEAVERYALEFLSEPMNFSQSMSLPDVEEFYRTAEFPHNLPRPFFINNANVKFLWYSILYQFSDHAFFSPVYVRDLTRPLFSVKNYQKKLLFINDDLKKLSSATPEKVNLLNKNLNELARRLRKKGITLYFMPAADKYNVYSDYIVDNPYPKSVFFDLLRKEPKEYLLVDTKALLQEEVRKGELDVYYSDDTHWSWKGSKKIAENMRFH